MLLKDTPLTRRLLDEAGFTYAESGLTMLGSTPMSQARQRPEAALAILDALIAMGVESAGEPRVRGWRRTLADLAQLNRSKPS